ncbi:hypothetical protein JCM1840_002228 [Sporobolomyces johnsonii]
MSARRTLSTLAVALFSAGGVSAMFSDGTISARDYRLTYAGYNNTLDFCTAFRAECINYVGALDAHHQLDCVVNQTGPTIYAFCGGKEKTANGDTGDGPTYDFTTEVCPDTTGCTIATDPVSPTLQWSGSFPTSTLAGSSSPSSAASTEATTSATVVTTSSAEEEVASSVATPTATTLATVAKSAKPDAATSTASTADSSATTAAESPVAADQASSSLKDAAAAVMSSTGSSSSSTSAAASSSSTDAASSATSLLAKVGTGGVVAFIAGVVATAM